MEDDASIFLDGKTLANLRVVDLKLELEKRGLSKSGSKKDLVKRLKQQLEFEKLCGERKTTGDCDLKLELDADTEQNEFVQQYLAQQQKIYAQQKEAKRRVELEEIQKSGDEKESCDSTKGDDDKTEDESETERTDKVTNDSTISLPPNKHTKDEIVNAFEATDTAQPSSVNQGEHSNETKYQNAENIKKNRKTLIQNKFTAETHQPNVEVRDIEKDREKELSTAISSLLSVEKSEKDTIDQEDISVIAESNAVDGGVTRMTHDDDREKDLATAVLSSLLVDQDVETEAKVVHNVEAKVDHNVETEAKVYHNVELEAKVNQNIEIEVKVEDKVEIEAKIDHSVEMEGRVDHNVETEAKVGNNVKIEIKVDHNVETEAKVDHNVKTENKIDHIVGTEAKVDLDVEREVKADHNVKREAEVDRIFKRETEIDHIVKTEAKVDHNVKREAEVDHNVELEGKVDYNVKTKAEVDHHIESNVVVADTCRKVDSQLKSIDAKTSSGVDQTCVKSVADMVLDSVEVNVKRTVDVKDGGQSSAKEASLEVVQKPPVEPSKITQAVQEEINSKMDVSSVPYSLSEIQLPESPINIVKPQSKLHPGNESSRNTQSDEDLESNNINSKSNKVKRSESGDLNGKDTKSIHKDKSSGVETTFEKELDNENARQEKASNVDSAKRSRVEQSESDASSDDQKSRLESKKSKGHRKKHDSSDDNRSPVKRSSDSSRSKSGRRKDRRNRSASSEEDGHSRDRSRSPKGSKSSRRNRRSSEKDHHSRKSKKSSREGRRKRDRKHRSKSSEEDRDRSPKKSSKVGRRERSVSSEEDRPSRTQSKESPKKNVKGSQKEHSVNSDDEQSSKVLHRESPKMETKESRSDRSDTPEKKQPLDSEISDSQKSGAVACPGELGRSPEEQHSRPHSEGSPKKESSHKTQSPRKGMHGSEEQDSVSSSSSESSPQKFVTKDIKRKHSVSSDEESKGKESPVKKPKTIPAEELSKPEDKIDCQSPRDEPSRSSRKNRSPKPTEGLKQRTSSSRSRSPPQKVSMEPSKSSKRPPSPKEARRPSSSDSGPENDVGKASPERMSKVVSKEEVSDGELSSSGESSPLMRAGETVSKWGQRKPSANSGTITVIRKEAPKQRLKIKRDNVVVVMKEPESMSVESPSVTEAPIVETPEPTENQKLEPGECSEVPANAIYVSRKITLANRKRTEKPNEEPLNKRSKWGSFAASRKAKQTVSISTDSLKNWFPDFKLLKEPAAELIPEDPPSPVNETKDIEMTPVEKDVEEPKPMTVTRRLEPPPLEEDQKSAAAVDLQLDAGVDPTRILFVRNLVRPFTLLQLKELLQETGKTVDEGFWIDKIKSKCFVTYETEEEAIKTRSVLNGARWPMSNPKILAVDFATEEDVDFHRSGAIEKPKPPLPPSSPPRPKEEDRREGRRERIPVREWDKDKMTQESPEKMDRRHHDERTKGADKDKKEVKRRPNEDTPAKLLDDLFQKTKATPCIYWLPLTEEQVKERVEKLRQVNLERERRNQEREQENKRPRSKQRGRETETRRSSSRSRSPMPRRR